MAIVANITKDHHVFVGEDKKLRFTIYADHAKTEVVDVSGFSMYWALRKTDKASDPALIEKSTDDSPAGITVEGTYDADPEVNTQQVVVTLKDTDSWDPTTSPPIALKQFKYRHALKRSNQSLETVLAFGDFQFLMATTRD
jgi:hypothetical protein